MNTPSASVNGGLIMGLGIASIFCFGIILGPIAIIMANNAMATLQATGDPTSQMSNVNIGRICGIVGTVLAALAIIGYFVFGAAMVAALHSAPHNAYPNSQ